MMKYKTVLKVTAAMGTTVCGLGAAKLWYTGDRGVDVKLRPSTTTTTCSNSSNSDLQLQMVHILFRHGERTPINVIPNVEQATYEAGCLDRLPHTTYRYKEQDLFGGPKGISPYEESYKKRFLKGGANVGSLTKLGQDGMYRIRSDGEQLRHNYGGANVGSLTKLGQDGMYRIGEQLRRDYVGDGKFLGPEFNPRHVYVRSTNVHRTIASARCLLAGMFGHLHLDNLTEEPVIHIAYVSTDELLPRPRTCKVLRQINHAAIVHGGDIPGIVEDRELLEKVLDVPAGEVGHRNIHFINMRDDIVAREVHGHSIPESLRPYRDVIERHAVSLMYYAFCGQHEAERTVAMRLSTGLLIRMVIDNMTNKDHSDSHKMYLLSCHDSSLVGLLGTLDIFDDKWPPFGADVRFELFEDKQKQQFVKVSYNGKPEVVRGCKTELCPLADFHAGMAPYYISRQQFTDECASNILEEIAKEMLEQEKGEVEDAVSKKQSDTPAGM